MCISLSKTRPRAPVMAANTNHEAKQQQQQQPHGRRSSSHHAHHHHSQHHHRHFTVQHNYHDHAADSAPSFLHSAQEITPMRGSTSAPFPVKLYEMLERVEADGFGHIVSWQPHGRCFVVHRTDLFKDLLSRYFTLSKIASFQRQLNLYGFMRLTRGLDKGGYYHEMFLRGKPFLMRRIQRVKVKGTGVRARSNPEQEPDFWSMSWVGQPSTTSSGQVQSSSPSSSSPQQTMARATSSASIVSHEDESSSSGEDESSRPTSPPPVVPVVSSSTVSANTAPLQDATKSNSDDLIMTGWGKPFYFLGSLPDPKDRVVVVNKQAAAAAAPSNMALPVHPPMYSSSSKPLIPAAAAAVAPEQAPSSSSSVPEMELMQDLDLDELVHDIVDGNFLDILERIIE